MALEIERKFLLAEFPDGEAEAGRLRIESRRRIEQTYLAIHEEEELRLRKLTDLATGEAEYVHTFKRGRGIVREEIETTIAAGLYDQVIERVGYKPLVKTRTACRLAEGNRFVDIEIDDYEQLRLLVAEVEFPDEASANAFVPPSWFGEEISSSKTYSNKEIWRQLQN
ncbi:adenylate cyclase [Paenibacillus sp. TRM 82003]|nr:adenylate cyclase [Paenibacillus sp. TRM 82003]